MLEEQFYASRRLTDQNFSNLTDVNMQRYVLDPVYRQTLLYQTGISVQQPNIDIQNDQEKVISPEATSMNTTRDLNTNQQQPQQLMQSSGQPTA